MIEGLSELVTACRSSGSTTAVDQIAEGATHWFKGYPVPAPTGAIALAQSEAVKLVFREEDIREVRKVDQTFLVRVRSDANILVSVEQVIKAGPTHCCEDKHPTGEPKRTARFSMDPDSDVNLNVSIGPCLFTIECFDVVIPFLGPRRVCIPTGMRCV